MDAKTKKAVLIGISVAVIAPLIVDEIRKYRNKDKSNTPANTDHNFSNWVGDDDFFDAKSISLFPAKFGNVSGFTSNIISGSGTYPRGIVTPAMPAKLVDGSNGISPPVGFFGNVTTLFFFLNSL